MTENGEMEVIVKFFTLLQGISLAFLVPAYLWCAQPTAVTAASVAQQKTASAPATQHNIPVDCFDITKQLVNLTFTDKSLSNCDATAQLLIKTLNGTSMPTNYNRSFLEKDLSKFNACAQKIGDDYEGIVSFFTDISLFSNQEFFNFLLYTPDQPEHSLVYITARVHPYVHIKITDQSDYHSVIIEKFYDGKSLWWRIYQSCDGKFTLHEWLGLAPWQNNKFVSHFNDFGQGKQTDHFGILKYFYNLSKKNTMYYRLSSFSLGSKPQLEQQLSTALKKQSNETIPTKATTASAQISRPHPAPSTKTNSTSGSSK